MPETGGFQDTIFALSSGAGMAGVAVVRLSGANVDRILGLLGVDELPPPRQAALYGLTRPDDGSPLDQGLVVRFPAPASFTGEDVAELHVHGSDAILSALFEDISQSEMARLAEPGEFTRRAFENGKLDLTQAEGLADLIEARTEGQRKLALKQYDGVLADLYDRWRAELVDILAYAEAEIDFSDEELPEALHAQVVARINQLKQEIVNHSSSALLGENLRLGLPVTILGAPNVGKSSLLNALARRDAAIVSEEAGTTRDVVEVQLNLGGYAVNIQDTAGLHEAQGEVEAEGIRRAESRGRDAALKIVVLDGLASTVPALIAEWIDESAIVVASKLDLAGTRLDDVAGFPVDFHVSAITGTGIGELLAEVSERVASRLSGQEGAVPTRQRHRDALRDAREALDRALSANLPELAAEDIRLATRALGRITGRVDVDEMLEAVFRDFCIGK